MAERYTLENRRHIEQSERGFAESMLGKSYTVRVYARYKNTARGTVVINGNDGYSVHTAYIICASENIGTFVDGVAVGILIDERSGAFSMVLSETADEGQFWMQYQIAEAVDYWENGNAFKIYCLREKSCGAVVYTESENERRYLIIRMNLGHCGLPKGHIEKYETEEETAIREVKEETGVDITLVEGFRKSVIYSLSSRTTKESVYFLGRFDGDSVKIQEAEVSSYRLCSYEQARRIITYENDRTILDAAEELLREREALQKAAVSTVS